MVRIASALMRGFGSAVSFSPFQLKLNIEKVNLAYLYKSIDGEDDQFRLSLSIIHQVQVDKLLLLQILGLLRQLPLVLQHDKLEKGDLPCS